MRRVLRRSGVRFRRSIPGTRPVAAKKCPARHCGQIEKKGDKIIASPLDGRESFEVQGNDLVSMNFFGFTPLMFDTLEKGLVDFFKENQDNLLKCEYLIPDVVFKEIQEDKKVYILESIDKWLGVTYKEDKEHVVSEIQKLIERGEYPNDLWK